MLKEQLKEVEHRIQAACDRAVRKQGSNAVYVLRRQVRRFHA